MTGLSHRTEEEILKRIPNRGHYAAVRQDKWFKIVWRHAGDERTLVQFIGSPHMALRIASDMNFVHEDKSTGETIRNWGLLKIAWWDGRLEPSRLILPFAR